MKVANTILSGQSAETGAMVLPETTKQDVPSTWIVDDNNPTHGWLVENSYLKKRAYGRGERAVHNMWLPTKSYAPLPPTQPTPPSPP